MLRHLALFLLRFRSRKLEFRQILGKELRSMPGSAGGLQQRMLPFNKLRLRLLLRVQVPLHNRGFQLQLLIL